MGMSYDAMYVEKNSDAETNAKNKWEEKIESIQKIFLEKAKLEHPTVNFRL